MNKKLKAIKELPGYLIGPEGEVWSIYKKEYLKGQKNKKYTYWYIILIENDILNVSKLDIIYRYHNPNKYHLFDKTKSVARISEGSDNINNLILIDSKYMRLFSKSKGCGQVRKGRYYARICFSGKFYSLGAFNTEEESKLVEQGAITILQKLVLNNEI